MGTSLVGDKLGTSKLGTSWEQVELGTVGDKLGQVKLGSSWEQVGNRLGTSQVGWGQVGNRLNWEKVGAR